MPQIIQNTPQLTVKPAKKSFTADMWQALLYIQAAQPRCWITFACRRMISSEVLYYMCITL